MMFRIVTLIWMSLFSCLGYAKQNTALYQVDLIVFTHQQTTPVDNNVSSLLMPDMYQAIPLQNNGSNGVTPYHTLPIASSQLRNEYWALSHKPQYQVLLHYAWLQPSNNDHPVALSQMSNSGWNVEGTLKIQQNGYYTLDSELFFSAPNSKQTTFVFSQKQRLKPGIVYYLDHPQAGMLIKIHQLA